MRETHKSLVIVGVCLLVAGTVFAGGINKLGSTAPTLQTIFRVDTPADGATVFGIVEVRGYVLDQRGVSKITLLVDGASVHDVDINQPRADVQLKYPSFRGQPFPVAPGFVTSFLATNYSDGNHTIALQVTYGNSDVATLGLRTVTVDNSINQGPIGALDSPRDPELAGMQDQVNGVYPITGWALDDQGIRLSTTVSPTGCDPTKGPPLYPVCHYLADIEVMMDGRVIGQAIYWLPRPDVANAHPDVADALESGWQMNLDTTRYANGPHTISVRAWDQAGMNTILGSRDVWIDNNYATLKPFGRIDWPMSDGHLFSSSCYIPPPISGIEYDPTHHIDWVSGWVVDQNDNPRFLGVKYVELLLDGALLKSSSTDCFYFTEFGMNVNCYGQARYDIAYAYPQFGADAKQAGFFFAVDADYLLSQGFHRGLHYLAIRVGTQDPTRPAEVIDQIPVILDCDDSGDEPAFGNLERPVNMQDMQGVELIKGWVIDYNNFVRQLNFYVDGILDGSLVSPSTHLNMLRMDVETAYPWLPYPYSRYNGFEYNLDTSKYVDGVHQLIIESIDWAGFHTYWVQRPVRFDNPN